MIDKLCSAHKLLLSHSILNHCCGFIVCLFQVVSRDQKRKKYCTHCLALSFFMSVIDTVHLDEPQMLSPSSHKVQWQKSSYNSDWLSFMLNRKVNENIRASTNIARLFPKRTLQVYKIMRSNDSIARISYRLYLEAKYQPFAHF